MAKNDAVAVLHAVLDYRRIMDVPGYEKIALHPATRFIGTMNYGYAGTKAVDMRGLIGAIRLIHGGLTPIEAIEMGITNKSFDIFEHELISDIVMTRIPDTWKSGDIKINPTDLQKSPEIAFYNMILQGDFQKYFDAEVFETYIRKKIQYISILKL